MATIRPTGYLAHYGIQGQKWGVRRFQHEDGTLTEEGKKRYGVVTTRTKEEVYKSPTPKEVYAYKNEYTDQELSRLYQRMVLENNIEKLAGSSTVTPRKQEIIKFVNENSNKILSGLTVAAGLAAGKKLIRMAFPALGI